MGRNPTDPSTQSKRSLLEQLCRLSLPRRRISENHRAKQHLRTQCERPERTLSCSTQAAIETDSLLDGSDFSVSLSTSAMCMMSLFLLPELPLCNRDVFQREGTQQIHPSRRGSSQGQDLAGNRGAICRFRTRCLFVV